MPASRNDITRKAQYVTTSRQPRWTAVAKDGKTYHIWSANLAGAKKHAKAEGWKLVSDKPFND
jgi:hypothetical protein